MKEKKGNQFRAPQNQLDALTLALTLALTAPSDEACVAATQLAEQIAGQMDEVSIARCKREALKVLEAA
jgi:hypothetical protein